MKEFVALAIILCLAFSAMAGGIRGTVRGENNETLAFATIFVREINDGTSSNSEGRYTLELSPGSYTVTFQYMGYESKTVNVEVGNDYLELNAGLVTQTLVLQDVKIRASKEDPAYTIMRKAIAKSKYHTQFIDQYTAEVYIKGTGQLKDAPFFMKGTLKKEGVELNKVFVSESISQIEYIRPSTYKEKVISIRSSMDNDKTGNPNGYINGSFYEPELANSVSPLSPKAFLYYRFEYDGTFTDRGYEVSKIKVIPRSKGDNVFAGYIQIIEGLWSIHSLDLEVTKLGIKFDIRQVYAPIQKEVWLPVTHKFEVTGKVFGFDFEANYLANVSKYSIKMNPDLDLDVTVIDEKVDKDLAKELEKTSGDESLKEIQKQLNEGKEVTGKQFRKMLKEYEKEENKKQDDPDVIYNRTFKVDSSAYIHDSLYWANVRPVPLSKAEVTGYHFTDSLAVIEKQKEEGDTLKARYHDGFKPWDILVGNSYKMGNGRFTIDFPRVNYNTVDGWNLHYQVGYSYNFKNKENSWFKISPAVRYNFAREAWNGQLETHYGFGKPNRRSDINISGGRYVSQFNDMEPIHPIVNSVFSLLFGDNYMKIYEKDFLKFSYQKKWDKLQIGFNSEYSRRRFLENHTDYSFKDTPEYTSNAPENEVLETTSFDPHTAWITSASIEYRPWLKYRIYNGKKFPLYDTSPRFKLLYRHGDADVDFDHIELGFRHSFKIGIQGFADLALTAGIFPGEKPEYLMDFKHFPGNQTPFVTSDYLENFRLLPYYQYSINDHYFSGFFQYQFRKLLLTRIPIIRLAGIREGFFINNLTTGTSDNYTELGYGINYILRIFRIEVVTSFQDGKYQDFGVRIGIATNLDDIF